MAAYSRRPRRFWRSGWLIGPAVLGAMLAAAGPRWIFPPLARWLVLADPLAPADLIVVLGGDGERIGEGVRLYQRGYGQRVLFTSADVSGGNRKDGAGTRTPKSHPRKEDPVVVPWSAELERVLSRGAIPDSALLLDATAASTCQEARAVSEVMESKEIPSVIIVSSPYHMRRVRWVFRHLIRRASTRVFLHPVSSSWFHEDNWWRHRRGVKTFLSEYIKLLYAVATC
ncbi:MAG: YdcF family protein [Nitrospinota bacterium]